MQEYKILKAELQAPLTSVIKAGNSNQAGSIDLVVIIALFKNLQVLVRMTKSGQGSKNSHYINGGA